MNLFGACQQCKLCEGAIGAPQLIFGNVKSQLLVVASYADLITIGDSGVRATIDDYFGEDSMAFTFALRCAFDTYTHGDELHKCSIYTRSLLNAFTHFIFSHDAYVQQQAFFDDCAFENGKIVTTLFGIVLFVDDVLQWPTMVDVVSMVDDLKSRQFDKQMRKLIFDGAML